MVSDMAKILTGVYDKVKETNTLNVELANDIFKEFSKGSISMAECTVISLVRWAKLGGMAIDEQSVALNVR